LVIEDYPCGPGHAIGFRQEVGLAERTDMPRPSDSEGIADDGQILSVLNNFRGLFGNASGSIVQDGDAILICIGDVM
jgi:hypothetical protein